jgi:hypothetical protein
MDRKFKIAKFFKTSIAEIAPTQLTYPKLLDCTTAILSNSNHGRTEREG